MHLLHTTYTHREHLQCYGEFDAAFTFEALHAWPGLDKAWFHRRDGSQKQAIAYCTPSKGRDTIDPTFIEGPEIYGSPKHQGERSDLLEVARDVQSGHSLKRVALDHPVEYIKFSTGIQRLKALTAPIRRDETIAFVFYGAGGSGKSSFASCLATYLSVTGIFHLPLAKGSGLYFDGYDSGDVVIIDEFKGNRMQPTFFNALIDRQPIQVPIHGGTTPFNSKYVLITTNVHPMLWWPNLEFKRSLRRRLIIFPIFRNLSYIRTPTPLFLFNGHPTSFSQTFHPE